MSYHPKIKKLGKLNKDLLPFLYSDKEVQKNFSPPPVVSYRNVRKIKYYIVRSKLYPLEAVKYTGKTTARFRHRWNNCKMEARKAGSGDMENVTQKFLQSYFLQDDHKGFLEDVEVRLIDKTQGSDPTRRE